MQTKLACKASNISQLEHPDASDLSQSLFRLSTRKSDLRAFFELIRQHPEEVVPKPLSKDNLELFLSIPFGVQLQIIASVLNALLANNNLLLAVVVAHCRRPNEELKSCGLGMRLLEVNAQTEEFIYVNQLNYVAKIQEKFLKRASPAIFADAMSQASRRVTT